MSRSFQNEFCWAVCVCIERVLCVNGMMHLLSKRHRLSSWDMLYMIGSSADLGVKEDDGG